jgi:putative transposase
MGRPLRQALGGAVYHVLNRANGRIDLFEQEGDYAAFERVLQEAHKRYPIRLLAYCMMPNHWHLVCWPYHDGDLSRFVGWLTLTHTQRWHADRHSHGSGHLYQGRFKTFLVQTDAHLLTVCRYVERNALRAKLVARAEDWRWGSLWWRHRSNKQKADFLSEGPVALPADWSAWVNEAEPAEILGRVRQSVQRGQPFGAANWVVQQVERFGLQTTVRPQGRPSKGSDENGS